MVERTCEGNRGCFPTASHPPHLRGLVCISWEAGCSRHEEVSSGDRKFYHPTPSPPPPAFRTLEIQKILLLRILWRWTPNRTSTNKMFSRSLCSWLNHVFPDHFPHTSVMSEQEKSFQLSHLTLTFQVSQNAYNVDRSMPLLEAFSSIEGTVEFNIMLWVLPNCIFST